MILLAILLAQTVQPVQGTGKPGTPATGIVSVQGVPAGTPMPVTGTLSIAGAADTVGASATFNGNSVCATVNVTGQNGVGFFLNSGTLDGTLTPYFSQDATVASPNCDANSGNWTASQFIDGSGNTAATKVVTNPNSFVHLGVRTIGGTRCAKVCTTTFNSNSASGWLTATQSVSTLAPSADVTDRVGRLLGHVSVDSSVLPANAAKETGGNLDSLVAKDFATQTTLALIKAKTDNLDVALSTRTKPADSQTVSGTVAVSNSFALDATLTGGSQQAQVKSGSKGATAAALVTSTANGVDHQGLDVQLQNTSVAVTGTVTTSPPSNASTNVAQLAGTATDTNSGSKSAGTLRVVLATDQPALTNKILVTPDSVALPSNQSVNVSQINSVTPLMGNGGTGTGSPRVTIASDNTAFAVNAAQSGTWTMQPGNTQNTTPWSTAVLDQTVAATVLSAACVSTGSCGATTAIVLPVTGLQTAELIITAISSPLGFAVACDTSFDGNSTYQLAKCVFEKSDAASTGTTKTALANGDLAAATAWQLQWNGAPSHIRIRVSTATSGNVTAAARAVFAPPLPSWVGVAIVNGVPINAAGSTLGLPMLTADSATSTTGRMARSDANGLLVSQSVAANLNATVTGTVTTSPPANASTNIAQINGVTPLMGNGVTGTGSPRVTIANDSNIPLPAAHVSASTSEILVLSTTTAVSIPASSKSCELYNHGPNTIYCNLNAAAVVNKCRPIIAESTWTLDADPTALSGLQCIAATASQLTTAATILSCTQ